MLHIGRHHLYPQLKSMSMNNFLDIWTFSRHCPNVQRINFWTKFLDISHFYRNVQMSKKSDQKIGGTTMTFDLLAEMERDGFSSSRKSTSRSGQYNGHCIFSCGGLGRDRLRVQPNHGDYGWFACNVCGTKGTGIDYLMVKRGWSKHEALAYVGWKPRDGSEPTFIIPRHVLAGEVNPTHEAPCGKWQTSAKEFVKYCVENLWSERGQEALDYLRSRGLKDETIKAAQLGYNPAKLRQSAEKWGRKQHGRLSKGIVLPWFIGADLWRITIRDEQIQEGENRYKQVAGGSNGLYLADSLTYHRPVVLVEGEFDALSVAQEAGGDVSVCATGTTEGSHTTKWIAALARKDLVLLAFDAEEKGDKAAQWWLDRLENAHRLRPWWKDANQMLQDGVDLRNDWILPRIEAVLQGEPALDGYLKCHACQKPFPDFEGWEPENIPAVEVMSFDPEDEQPYCEECRPDLFTEETSIAKQEPCSYEQFQRDVQAISDAIPGGCTITYQPRGYTLQQRVSELEAEARQARREEEARVRTMQYNHIFKHSPILEEAS
jgi:5S rRNA maturation endonuclease (ribonuclease M5)